MAEPRIFDTYAEAGAFLQDNNPDLKMQPDVAARKFEEKNPHVMRVMEGMGTMETVGVHAMSGVNAANRLLGQVPGSQTTFSEAAGTVAGGLDSGAGWLNQIQEDAGAGVSSGVTMGATEQLSQYVGNEPKSGLAFGAGEMVGEMIGPYKAANMVIGSTKMGAKMAGATGARALLGRSAMGGLEAAPIEAVKSLIRGEDLSEAAAHGAVGFGIGTAMSVALRGAYIAGRAGVKKWLGPSDGEIDMEMVKFFAEEGIEDAAIAPILRPDSAMVNYVEARTMASNATLKIYNNARQRLIDAVYSMQGRLNLRLGDNVSSLPPSEVGVAVADDITTSVNRLKELKNTAYDKVNLTEISEVPIKPNAKVTLQYPNEAGELGEPVETSILDGLADIIGRDVINGNAPPKTSVAVRDLLSIYKWVKRNATKVENVTEEYHDASASHFADPHINPTTGGPMPYKGGASAQSGRVGGPWEGEKWDPRYKPVEGTVNPGVRQDLQGRLEVESPGEYGSRLDIQGAPMTSKTTTEVTYKTYGWWWKRAQEIGDMLDRHTVTETPKDKEMVGKAYHLIRDVMDNYASSVSPAYKLRIDAARAAHINYTTFKNHPTVKEVLKLGFGVDGKSIAQPENIMPKIFKNVSSVRGIKQLLGPDVFAKVRQSWLIDLLSSSIEIESNGTIKNVVAKKLMTKLQRYEGLDGELLPEMFSDEGFFTPDGMPMSSNSKSPVKYEDFKDFIKKVGMLNDATERMQAGGRMEMTSAERLQGGSFTSYSNALGAVKAAVATMLVAKRGAQELLEPYGKSIFLGGQSAEKPFLNMKLPGGSNKSPMQPQSRGLELGEDTLRQLPTIAANRLRNR